MIYVRKMLIEMGATAAAAAAERKREEEIGALRPQNQKKRIEIENLLSSNHDLIVSHTFRFPIDFGAHSIVSCLCVCVPVNFRSTILTYCLWSITWHCVDQKSMTSYAALRLRQQVPTEVNCEQKNAKETSIMTAIVLQFTVLPQNGER